MTLDEINARGEAAHAKGQVRGLLQGMAIQLEYWASHCEGPSKAMREMCIREMRQVAANFKKELGE